MASDRTSEYQVRAHRLLQDEQIVLDGFLDEPLWQRIHPVTNFRQQNPDEGGPPTEHTEVYVAYDEQNLYIGVKLYDSNPENILAFQRRRNHSLATDDRFMWILDTFHDGRFAYFFEINPLGMMGDGLLSTGQGGWVLNNSWDGIWDARVRITNEGWTAEIRIPFRTLDFNPDHAVWGINFQRSIRRKNEEIVWSGWRRHQGLFRPQHAGQLVGLHGLSQGIGLEATPYGKTRSTHTWFDNTEVHRNFIADAGFDLTYSITPGIRASLTVNTDFAESEVDQRRVNLTRFPLVFPEQRDFFLEGSNVFSFAPASGITPLFTRRIGLIEGVPVPIHAGARVIGRTGNTNIGFYQIRTGESIVNKEDFTVARIVQNIFTESSVGILYTRRGTLDDDFFPVRQTLAFDLELGTSRFMGSKNLQFQSFFVMHTPDNREDESDYWNRTSRGVRLAFPNYPFSGHVSYREFGDAFNPAVGIAPRIAFRRLQPTFTYSRILSEHPVIRSVDFDLRYELLMDLNFKTETMQLSFLPLGITFESGDVIRANIARNYERLDFPFDIRRDQSIVIPPGDYYTWSHSASASSASYRKVSGTLAYMYEGFWSGTRFQYSTYIELRPVAGFNLSGEWTRNNISLKEGSFHTDLFWFRGNIDPSPWTSFTTIFQFDNLSNIVGFYNRLRWILRPGTDIYLVYTWNWRDVDGRFDPIEAGGTVKVNYTLRL